MMTKEAKRMKRWPHITPEDWVRKAYTQHDIQNTYEQGMQHGKVEGVFYGIIIACLFAIFILWRQM